VVTVLPYLSGMSGLIYLASALLLDAVFLRHAWLLRRTGRADLPMRTFKYSIQYLALLFAALLIDHYLLIRP
jgi:protoheme IX farnesyltransferase